jgi:hypothetical protein
LISAGKITVNQFRTAMYRMRDEGTAFFDTLMIEGWLSAADIFDPTSDLWDMPSETGGQTLSQNSAPPKAVPPEWTDVPEELLADMQEQDNGKNGEHNDKEGDQEPASVAAWSERDALAETQALDVSQFRAQLAPAEED